MLYPVHNHFFGFGHTDNVPLGFGVATDLHGRPFPKKGRPIFRSVRLKIRA